MWLPDGARHDLVVLLRRQVRSAKKRGVVSRSLVLVRDWGMSRTARISDRLLMRTQATSGLVFSAFVVVHLLPVMASPLGPGIYDAIQRATRRVYQHPAIEILGLMLPLGIHVVVSVLRMKRRSKVFATRGLPWRTRLHRCSAWFLLLFIAGHILATRGPSVWSDVWPGFAGLSFTMEFAPAYFYPYYMLLGIAGLVHASWGVWLATRVPHQPRPRRPWAIPGVLGLGSALIVLGVLSFGGVFYAIEDPMENDFARLYQKLVSAR